MAAQVGPACAILRPAIIFVECPMAIRFSFTIAAKTKGWLGLQKSRARRIAMRPRKKAIGAQSKTGSGLLPLQIVTVKRLQFALVTVRRGVEIWRNDIGCGHAVSAGCRDRECDQGFSNRFPARCCAVNATDHR